MSPDPVVKVGDRSAQLARCQFASLRVNSSQLLLQVPDGLVHRAVGVAVPVLPEDDLDPVLLKLWVGPIGERLERCCPVSSHLNLGSVTDGGDHAEDGGRQGFPGLVGSHGGRCEV